VTDSLPPEDPRDALIREQAARIAAQDERVTVLEALVAELRGQLEAALRAASRNSGNSSMPPSGDDLPGRKPPRKERRAAERAEKKRGRGKQPGSPGAAMRMREPDETLDHCPEGSCECGLDLAGAAGLGVSRSYQQEDVPEPRPSRRYQHNLHKARCACGKVHVAPRPDGVPDAPLSVGPRLSAMAVYLSVFQHVPVERARLLISDLTGGVVSAGFVHSCLAKAAGLVKDSVALIRTLIAASPVAGFDETTLRSGPAGEKKYVHGAFTGLYSAFHLGTRSIESMKAGGIPELFAGVVVSDRYQGYWSETWESFAGHQACAAHLIRDFADCAETYPGSGWPEQAQRALRGLIRAWHAAREQGLPSVPDEVRTPLDLEFRRAVTFGVSAVPRVPGPRNAVKQRPGREMLEFCRDREADVLRFGSDTTVWPTNNISERGVRPLKTQQKISGRLTSDDVTQDRLDIRGYIDTARKHGLGALEVLEQLMLGHPWMPRPSPSHRKAKATRTTITLGHPGECLLFRVA
jgi:transposase